MPLEVPSLDQRHFNDLLRDALARIPVHNPEWTNFNDSDPGVTLIQLFAFMTESILYRTNQIPERNRYKFLKLLGIPLRPAAAAKAFITIRNERGPLEVRVFDQDQDVRAGAVRFRTMVGLEVLPVEARVFYKKKLGTATSEQGEKRDQLYTDLYSDLLGDTASPAFYETTQMPVPQADGEFPVVKLNATVDHCLWIALLARPGDSKDLDGVRSQIANHILTVGVMPYFPDEGIVVEAGQSTRTETAAPVHWEIASVTESQDAIYETLSSRTMVPILATPGLVEITLPSAAKLRTWDFATMDPGLEGTGDYPPALEDSNMRKRVITWLRLRVEKSDMGSATSTQLSWLDINATMVEQRVNIEGEIVGTGSGEPDQSFTLANTSVLPETLRLTVDSEPWYFIDDLLAADPEISVTDPRRPLYRSEAVLASGSTPRAKRFTLDPEAGVITFGDGAHGARPRQGARIVADYAYGGGRQGNVAIGTLSRSPSLPAGYKVTNPLRAWGGDDAEEVAEAEKTIPRTFQHRDRLVSQQDFEDITRRTPGIDLGRVEILPLYHPVMDKYPVPGVITVMVIPASSAFNNPKPDQFFLQTVCNHLQPRRLITTELYVRGPIYVDVWVSVGVEILGGYATGPVSEAVRQRLLQFLSPIYGGHSGKGWPLDVSVKANELEAVVARVAGVQMVNEFLLGISTTSVSGDIPMTGLDLPRLAGVSVSVGRAMPLSQLTKAPSVVGELPAGKTKWTSIPVLPKRC